jgi:release factor glutamine methyltransferase
VSDLRPTDGSAAEDAPLGDSDGELVRDLRRAIVTAFKGRIENPEMEARDLIAAVADKPRSWPSLHPGARLEEPIVRRVCEAIVQRLRGAPFAYAVGRASFRHLTLDVDERVLIPRQETEVLVDVVLRWAAARGAGGLAIDVGTGSGAIALALATEGQFARVIATDVSAGALDVARRNLEQLTTELSSPVEFRQGAFLAPVRGESARVVVSNPPYIACAEMAELPRSVRDWEPPAALYAADGGMAMIAALAREAADVLEPGGLLAMEVDCRRGAACAALLRAQGCYHDVRMRPDLTGRDRVLTATREDG